MGVKRCRGDGAFYAPSFLWLCFGLALACPNIIEHSPYLEGASLTSV